MEINSTQIIFGLVILVILSFFAGKSIGKRVMYELMEKTIAKERKDAVAKSRSVLKGHITEQLSPFAEDFPVKASECRFLGAPTDFICFTGLDEQNVTEIVFIEVKSGNAKMNKTERSIADAVRNKRVKFIEYRQ